MKNYKILLVLILLTGGVANAQFKFGAVGGVNYSELKGHQLQNKKILGYNLGLISEYRMNRIGVELDVLYSTKGANFGPIISGGGNKLSDDYNFVLNYIDLPIVFKYHSVNLGGLSYQGGIQPSFYISGKVDGQKINSNNFNSTDLAAVLGFGVDLSRFHCSLRYNFGLKEIYSNSAKGKNNMLTFSLGFWIKSNIKPPSTE